MTPPHVASILDGISRKSIIQIARDLGYTVVERDVARAELYLAEEVFLCGTAAELVPVREIDDHELGEPGEVTKVIQAKFEDALHGRAPEYSEWLDVVEEPSKVTALDAVPLRRASSELAPPRPPDAARRPARPRPRAEIARPHGSERHSSDPGTRLRHDSSRRHAGSGHVALGGREGSRRPGARPARRPLHRGRLPELEPEGGGAVRAARRGRARAGARLRVRDDPPARRPRRRGRRAARPGRLRGAGRHLRRQDLGPPPREGDQGLAARRTCR